MSSFSKNSAVGADGGEGTPVPIPNTAVKLICADDTWLEAARENRWTPIQKSLEGNFEAFLRLYDILG